MEWYDQLLIGIFSVAGVGLLLVAWRSLRAARKFWQHPTVPIADVNEDGVYEVEGEAVAIDKAVRSATKERCLLVQTVEAKRQGKNNYRDIASDSHHMPAELHDASGRCVLDLEHVEVRGDVHVLHHEGMRITQQVIPVGARVLVLGKATVGEGNFGGAYRGGGGKLTRLAGTADEPLLIIVGSNRQAMARFGGAAAVAGLCGIGLLLIAASYSYLGSVLADLARG